MQDRCSQGLGCHIETFRAKHIKKNPFLAVWCSKVDTLYTQ